MKNSWVICGPESSGSVFIAKTISYAVGHCEFYGQYSGYGFNSKIHCENLVLHRSLPYKRPKRFQESLIEEISTFSDKYERVNYILTTRDKNCSIKSKMRRFKDSLTEANTDYITAAPFFERLTNDDRCFIWSYESMILLGKPYFLRLYRFFEIDSDFFPEIYDANAAYLTQSADKRKSNLIQRVFSKTISKAGN